jgi:hypothetical protein
MPFDQPRRPSPSIVPSPERVAAFMAEQRARVEEEVAAAYGRTTRPGPVPQLISGAANAGSAPEWVWPDRIARGKLMVLGGAPGSGKSAFVTDVIARVTAGSAWPCQEGIAPKGAVLLIAPHGDADVFGLRFTAAGGDLTQLHTLREVKDGAKARPFDLEKDFAALAPLIEGIKDLRLIAIDAMPVPAAGRPPHAKPRLCLSSLPRWRAAITLRCWRSRDRPAATISTASRSPSEPCPSRRHGPPFWSSATRPKRTGTCCCR